MIYKCVECGREVDVDLTVSRKVQCTFCGYRILRKVRPKTPKRVQAR